jgi:hypothetical protein
VIFLTRVAPRLGVAMASGSVACLLWVDRTPNNAERVVTGLAILAGLGLVVAAFTAERLPPVVIDPAAALAAAVLVYDGMESLIVREQAWDSIVRDVLGYWGVALVALAIMVDVRREARR